MTDAPIPLDSLSLDDLRAEIDAIDTAIHDLLMRRAAVVTHIGARKRPVDGAPLLALRPDREAEILRRLVDRHQGPFPTDALVQIWREMLAAFSRLQGPIRVALFQAAGGADCLALARIHFGALTPIRPLTSAKLVFRAVTEGEAAIGVLPMPQFEDADPWWRDLLGPDSPHIIAKLPFAGPPPDTAPLGEAFAIARLDPAPTGADRSLLVVELDADISRARLNGWLANADLADIRHLSQWRPPEHGAGVYLIDAASFVERDDPRLDTLRQLGQEAIVRIHRIGTYAEPLSQADLFPSSEETA